MRACNGEEDKSSGVRKSGEWERWVRMKHEVVKKKAWDGGGQRGRGKGVWTQAR